jgi:hypothetical protein
MMIHHDDLLTKMIWLLKRSYREQKWLVENNKWFSVVVACGWLARDFNSLMSLNLLRFAGLMFFG